MFIFICSMEKEQSPPQKKFNSILLNGFESNALRRKRRTQELMRKLGYFSIIHDTHNLDNS